MIKNLYKNILTVVLLLSLLSASACNKDSQQYVADDTSEPSATGNIVTENEAEKPVAGGVLTLSVAKYSSLNPLNTDNEDIRQYMSLVYNNIVTLDYSTYPKAELADSWSCDETCTKWTFVLKSGIKWHDGSAFSAEDVVETINYVKKNGGNYAANVANIKNCMAIDDKTLELECAEPDGMLPCKMSIPVLKARALVNGSANTLPIGTGMYRYDTKTSSATKLVFSKNPINATLNSEPYIEGIEINVYESDEKKDDSVSDFSLFYDELFKADDIKENVKLINFSGDMYTYLLPNITGSNSVMSNVDLRQAISCFINRGNIINAASGGNGIAAILPAYQGTFCWSGDSVKATADVESGVLLLEKAGYIKGESGNWEKDGKSLTVKCIVPADYSEYCLAAERLRIELEKNGITLVLSYLSDKAYAQAVKSGSYDIAVMQISLGSWIELKGMFGTNGTMNFNKYSNVEIDELIKHASEICDKDEFKNIYDKIKNILMSDMPVIGLYVKGDLVLVSENLHGIVSGGIYPWDVFANIDKWYIDGENITDESNGAGVTKK